MLYGKFRTALTVLMMHYVLRICDLFLPNIHLSNLVRGFLIGPLLGSCGKRFAIASGAIINAPWKMHVGDGVYIAHNCWINAVGTLNIGCGVIISPNVVIATTSHDRVNGRVSLRVSRQQSVDIGDGAWIASNSVVTKGSSIGSGAIVGAGSVVSGRLADNCQYSGNPCEFIRQLS